MYNQQGEKIEQIALKKEMFETPLNADLVYQVAVSQMSNKRRAIAHTKHRGEVSGGGRKPWAQKGTGRARQGSIRSPLWRHGGVAFGPRNSRVFTKKINQKMRKAALSQIFSEKARQNLLFILEPPVLQTPKTKELAKIFEKIVPERKTALFVVAASDKALILAARNISFVQPKIVSDVNVLDLLQSKYVVMSKQALEKI